jgi:hypothetical protein
VSNATTYIFVGTVTVASDIFPVSVGDQFTGYFSYEYLTKPFAASLYHPPDIDTSGAICFNSFSIEIPETHNWSPYIRYSRDYLALEWEPGVFTGMSGVNGITDIILYSKPGTYFGPNKLPKSLNLSNFAEGFTAIELVIGGGYLQGTISSIKKVNDKKIESIEEPLLQIGSY